MAYGKTLLNKRISATWVLVITLFLIGLIPISWYRPGHLILTGDHFPYYPLNSQKINTDLHLWSSITLGRPSTFPALSLYGLLWNIPFYLGIEVGLWQTILFSIYLCVGACSMFFLSSTVFPEKKIASCMASIFYVFNFLVVTNLLFNVGISWTYSFLPLLIGLLIRVVTRTEHSFRNIALFSLSFASAASIASINPSDEALILISLSVIIFYYTIIERRIKIKYLSRNLAATCLGSISLSVWWMIPIFNTFFASSSVQLQQSVDVASWSWTHARGSFLNLFWLNGFWGWRPEYYAFYDAYANNWALMLLLFLPFLLASVALLFKSKSRKFNAYLMLVILIFIFLAKGLHEPLSFANLALYQYVPLMNMFREPASKFTLIMIPFLALLAGYAVEQISGKPQAKFSFRKLFPIIIISIFIISSFPIITNPIETKTEEIPYSSYVTIPQYWYDAEAWIKTKSNGYRILMTPFDAHYHVPYSWGAFFSDEFWERFFETPIISPCYSYSYTVNPNVTKILDQLKDSIAFNRTNEVEAILGLLNVKYIVQRNDIDYNYLASNNIETVDPNKMRDFLQNETRISFARSFGELDIYEYLDAQLYVRLVNSEPQDQYVIRELKVDTLDPIEWDFDTPTQLDSWRNVTPEYQFGVMCSLSVDDGALRFEINNSTWGWKVIASPLIQAQFGSEYSFVSDIKAYNAYQVHVKVGECDAEMKLSRVEYSLFVGDGTFDWKTIQVDYVPREENTSYVQLQIWSGHETAEPLPNLIWLDNVKIEGHRTELETANIERVLSYDGPARILSYEQINPTTTHITMNTSSQVVLTVSEAFDAHWKAQVNGKPVNPISVFSVMNGFEINETGMLDVLIEYEPQTWFVYGALVSFTTFLIIMGYFTYYYAKTKGVFLKVKQKLTRS